MYGALSPTIQESGEPRQAIRRMNAPCAERFGDPAMSMLKIS